MSGAGRDNLRFIQGVRGLAALAVVLYHARVYVDGPAYLHAGRRMFEGGAAGVDLFFVRFSASVVHDPRKMPSA